jgi:hypothetical protein
MPPHGKILQFTVIGEIRRTQSGAPNKLICLELIQFDEDRRKELRLGYYILGKLPKMPFAGAHRPTDLDHVGDLTFHGALDAILQRAGWAGLERDEPGVFHRATSRPSRRTVSTNAEAPSQWSTSEPPDHSASEFGPTRRSSHAAPSRVRGVT